MAPPWQRLQFYIGISYWILVIISDIGKISISANNMIYTSKTKKLKFLTRRIGIEVVIMKKLCKQEVIGMRMHQFKLSILK